MLINKGTPDDFINFTSVLSEIGFNYLRGFWNRQTNTIVLIMATRILDYFFLGKPG